MENPEGTLWPIQYIKISEEDCRLLTYVVIVVSTENIERLINDPVLLRASLKAETLSYQDLSIVGSFLHAV